MKKLTKALAIGGVTVGVGLASMTAVGVANAASQTSTTKTDGMSSLVQAIADKFKLKTSDVQAVFDSERTKMDAQREADAVAQQAQLVKDGKLTQAQSDAITAKRAELQKQREADRAADATSTKTSTERQTEMQARKTALDTWLNEQGIDTQYAYLLMGGRGHGGPGERGGFKDGVTATNSAASSTTN